MSAAVNDESRSGDGPSHTVASPPMDASPIWRLPDDVLSDVFVQHALYLAHGSLLECRTWTVITHVCCSWRAVALATPKLWTFLSAAWPVGLIRLFLERSGVLPIDVLDFGGYSVDPSNLKLILSHLHRLRRLQGFPPKIFRQLSDYAAEVARGLQSLPHLEKLDLHFISDTTFFPMLSSLSMPRLASLSVYSGTFQYIRTIIRPTITSLAILVPKELEDITLADLLDTLAGLPFLQSLNLLEAYRPPYGFDPQAPSLSLPQLTQVIMGGSRVGFIHILEHLLLPPTARFDISCFETTYSAFDLPFASTVRTHILAQPGAPRIRSVQLDVRVHSGWPGSRFVDLNFKFWPSLRSLDDLASSADDKTADGDTRLVLLFPTQEDVIPNIVAEIMTKVDLSAVETMYVRLRDGNIVVPHWRAILQAVPNVRELALEGVALDSLLATTTRGLSSPSSSSSPRKPPPLELPKQSLETLRLIDVTFTVCAAHDAHHRSRRWLVDTLATLKKDEGPSLKCLQIEDPINFTTHDYDALVQARVAEVVDVRDWGYISFVECEEREMHPEESQKEWERRMQLRNNRRRISLDEDSSPEEAGADEEEGQVN